MDDQIRKLLTGRLKEYVEIGPVHRSVVEDFADSVIQDVCNKLEPQLAEEILTFYGVEQ